MQNSRFVVLAIVHVVSMLAPRTLSAYLSDSQRLLHDKLVNYTKVFRPLNNQAKAIDVQLAFSLVSINEFNEREEKLTVCGMLQCRWRDEIFTWNPRDYGGVYYVVIDVGSIWVPHMTLVNPAKEIQRLDEDWHQLYVLNTGVVYYSIGGMFSVSCPVDVTYYPWDKQFCEIWFMAYGYSNNDVNLVQSRQNVSLSLFSENGAWAVVGSKTASEPKKSIATFGFYLERKPRFVVINILLPLILMSFMNALIFLIPSDSGERISYSIAVLLAIAVFLTLVGDNLPKTSNPMSVLSYYLLSVLVVSVCITLINIVSLRLFYKDDKEHVGSFWIWFTFVLQCKKRATNQSRMKPLLYLNNESDNSMTSRQSKCSGERGLPHITTIVGDENGDGTNRRKAFFSDENDEVSDVNITWKDVSCAFDKIAFFVFTITLVALAVIFWVFVSGTLSAQT